mmetsp:Transcript_4687/g.10111  ORF Transcript_4687/g.10111 Transcript_4687/m.10111 type:complete len:487 (+) Transcript_4687:319-1779(+)
MHAEAALVSRRAEVEEGCVSEASGHGVLGSPRSRETVPRLDRPRPLGWLRAARRAARHRPVPGPSACRRHGFGLAAERRVGPAATAATACLRVQVQVVADGGVRLVRGCSHRRRCRPCRRVCARVRVGASGFILVSAAKGGMRRVAHRISSSSGGCGDKVGAGGIQDEAVVWRGGIAFRRIVGLWLLAVPVLTAVVGVLLGVLFAVLLAVLPVALPVVLLELRFVLLGRPRVLFVLLAIGKEVFGLLLVRRLLVPSLLLLLLLLRLLLLLSATGISLPACATATERRHCRRRRRSAGQRPWPRPRPLLFRLLGLPRCLLSPRRLFRLALLLLLQPHPRHRRLRGLLGLARLPLLDLLCILNVHRDLLLVVVPRPLVLRQEGLEVVRRVRRFGLDHAAVEAAFVLRNGGQYVPRQPRRRRDHRAGACGLGLLLLRRPLRQGCRAFPTVTVALPLSDLFVRDTLLNGLRLRRHGEPLGLGHLLPQLLV